jgi:hypothetical protein
VRGFPARAAFALTGLTLVCLPASAAPRTFSSCLLKEVRRKTPRTQVVEVERGAVSFAGRTYSVPAFAVEAIQDLIASEGRRNPRDVSVVIGAVEMATTDILPVSVKSDAYDKDMARRKAVELRGDQKAMFSRIFHSAVRTNPRSEAFQRAFNGGTEIESVAIVTHQQSTMTQGTVRSLEKNPQLKDIPVVTLIQPDFPVGSRDLLTRSDAILYSAGGELDRQVPIPRTAHLYGGFCEDCLARSIVDLMTEFARRSSNHTAKYYIHAPGAYVSGPFVAGIPPPHDSLALRLIEEESIIDEIREEIEDKLEMASIKSEFSATREVQTPFGPALQFVVRLKPHGKSVTVHVLAE